MGGDHGHHELKIPDYRIYKLEDAPKLLNLQRKLASQGLKDPWIRNEVWRYNEKEMGTVGRNVRTGLFRGFKYGFAAFLLHAAGRAAYDRVFPDPHAHGHH